MAVTRADAPTCAASTSVRPPNCSQKGGAVSIYQFLKSEFLRWPALASDRTTASRGGALSALGGVRRCSGTPTQSHISPSIQACEEFKLSFPASAGVRPPNTASREGRLC